jgi:hypothetical protein
MTCILALNIQSNAEEPVPYQVRIGTAHSELGQQISIPVVKNSGSILMNGFDFLIGYNAAALIFLKAEPGQIFTDPEGWEYFVYRVGVTGNFGGEPFPFSLVRVVGIYDTNDGHQPIHQDVPDGDTLFGLSFQTSSDISYEDLFLPVKFFWLDCGDNSIAFSDSSGDKLAVSDKVYDPILVEDITDTAAAFPTDGGAPEICIDIQNPDSPVRLIDFFIGGVDVPSLTPIEDRGDINLNGISYEAADYVLFSYYFLYGLSAFTVNVDYQIAATDINDDGNFLTINDFVYLARVIEGNAPAYPVPPGIKSGDFSGLLYLENTDTSIIVRGDFEDSVGGLHISFYAPDLLSYDDYEIHAFPDAAHMDIDYDTYEGFLNLLIGKLRYGEGSDTLPATIPAGPVDILEIVYSGDRPVFSDASAAGYLGEYVILTCGEYPNTPPIIDAYPSLLTNDSSGGFYFDFNAHDDNIPADTIFFEILSGPGEISPETGVPRPSPNCTQ